MTQLIATAVIQAIDRFSGPMNKMAMTASRSAGMMEKRMAGASVKMARMGRMAGGPGSFGALLASGAFLKGAYNFDKSLRMIAANADVPYEKLDKLREMIVEIAQVYPKTRAEIARGALESVTAGRSLEQTRVTMPLMTVAAIASQQDIGKVTADVTDVIAGFYGAINDAEKYYKATEKTLNLMAVGASASNHVWQEQTLAMQYSVPVARALGLELDQLTAAIGVLADNGFKGEKGGSALRTMLLNLVAPTRKAYGAFSQLGIKMDRAFKFNAAKAFNAPGLMGLVENSFGKQGQAVIAAAEKTLNNSRLQGNVAQMRKILITNLSRAMNIAPGDLVSQKLLTEVIEQHFFSAMGNIDFDYLFNKLAKANAQQSKAITGVRRTPQMIALARGFRDQYLPKLQKIRDKAPGALDRRANTFLQGTAADIDRMVSSIDSLADSFEKSGVLHTVSMVASGIRTMALALKEANPGILNAIGSTVLFTASLAPIGFIMSGAASALAVFASAGSGVLGLLAKLSPLMIVGYIATDLLANGITRLLTHVANAPKDSLTGQIWAGAALGVQKLIDAYKWASRAVSEFWVLHELKSLEVIGGGGALALAGNFYTSKMSMWDFVLNKAKQAIAGIKGAFADLWGWIAGKFEGTALARGFKWIGDKVSQFKGWLIGRWNGSWLQQMLTAIGTNRYVNSPIKSMMEDLTSFGAWIDSKTSRMAAFWEGLTGGFTAHWEGSQIQHFLTFLKGSIDGLFGPAIESNAKNLGDKIASYLLNPLTALKDLFTGGLGTGGILAGLFVIRPLLGPMLHMGASAAIMAKGLVELGVGVWKLAPRLMKGARAFGAFMLAGGRIGMMIARFSILGAAIAVVQAYWGRWDGSQMQRVFQRIGGYISALAKKFSGESSLGKLFGRLADYLFYGLEKVAKIINVILDGVDRLIGALGRIGNIGDHFSTGLNNLRNWWNGDESTGVNIADVIKNAPKVAPKKWLADLPSNGSWSQPDFAGGHSFRPYGPMALPSSTYLRNLHNGTYETGRYTPLPKNKDGSVTVPSLFPRQPVTPLGVGAFGDAPVDITGKVDAELKGKATVNVRIETRPSPMLMSEIKGMIVSSEGHVAANVGVSNADAQSGN